MLHAIFAQEGHFVSAGEMHCVEDDLEPRSYMILQGGVVAPTSTRQCRPSTRPSTQHSGAYRRPGTNGLARCSRPSSRCRTRRQRRTKTSIATYATSTLVHYNIQVLIGHVTSQLAVVASSTTTRGALPSGTALSPKPRKAALSSTTGPFYPDCDGRRNCEIATGSCKRATPTRRSREPYVG